MNSKKAISYQQYCRVRDALCVSALTLCAAVASADTHYVSQSGGNLTPYTNQADAATAIQAAVDVASSGDTVAVDSGVYILSSEITISVPITLIGSNGCDQTVIDGNNACRCLILAVPGVIVEGFTIMRGKAQDFDGGGINCVGGDIRHCRICSNSTEFAYGPGIELVSGQLILTDCLVSANTMARPSLGCSAGMGIDMMAGHLILVDSVVSNHEGSGVYMMEGSIATTNSSFVNNRDGGMCAANGVIDVDGCVFDNNLGNGAINAAMSAVTVRNCLMTSNSTGVEGACVYANMATIEGCRMYGNYGYCGGAVSAGNGMTMMNCLVSNNTAGVDETISCGSGTFVMSNCTMVCNTVGRSGGAAGTGSGTVLHFFNCVIAGNKAQSGGGVHVIAGASAVMQNCTVYSNYSSYRGGGLFNAGNVSLQNCTFLGNAAATNGGGIYNYPGRVVTFGDSILADNRAPFGPDCFGELQTTGNNLLGTTTDCTLVVVSGSNIVGVSAMLAPLSDNGGPAQTCALLSGSPAIDQCSSNTLTEDARGKVRPIDGDAIPGAVSDIGAFEYDPATDSGAGQRTLTVQSSYGTPAPGTGTWLHAAGSPLQNCVSTPDSRGTTQYVCTGWVMTGNEPLSGGGANLEMTLTNDAVLTWTWATQYLFCAAAGAGGAVTPTSQWCGAGTVVTSTASPDPGKALMRWTGNTNDCQMTSNSLSALMTAPRSVAAEFGYRLAIGSQNPSSGVDIILSSETSSDITTINAPADIVLELDTNITITASFTAPNGNVFDRWLRDEGFLSSDRRIYIVLTAGMTLTAVYRPPPVLTFTSKNPDSGVPIGSVTLDCNGNGVGVTVFMRSYYPGSNVTATAPLYAPNGNVFTRWLQDGVLLTSNATMNVVATTNSTLTAEYETAMILTVDSVNPASGVTMTGVTPDNLSRADGDTVFTRVYSRDTNVSVTAPYMAPNGNVFNRWLGDGAYLTTNLTAAVTMSTNSTLTAVYGPPPVLTFRSLNPISGVSITGVTPDMYGNADGATVFMRTYLPGTQVAVVAPRIATNERVFLRWLHDGFFLTSNRTATIVVTSNVTLTAEYDEGAPLGTPQTWLDGYGLTNDECSVAETNDADGDGMSNWKEYLAGTDPTNADSVLCIFEMTDGNGTVNLRWPGSPWSEHTLQWKSNMLATDEWQTLCTFSADGFAETNFADSSTSNSTKFYRVKVDR